MIVIENVSLYDLSMVKISKGRGKSAKNKTPAEAYGGSRSEMRRKTAQKKGKGSVADRFEKEGM